MNRPAPDFLIVPDQVRVQISDPSGRVELAAPSEFSEVVSSSGIIGWYPEGAVVLGADKEQREHRAGGGGRDGSGVVFACGGAGNTSGPR